MSLQYHTLTSQGVTKTFADWGLAEAKLTFRQWACDELPLRAVGRNVDLTSLFPVGSTLSVQDANGTQIFVGRMTRKPPVKYSGKSEDQFYSLFGPWWYFETLGFQYTWLVSAAQGSGQIFPKPVPTLRATTIIGNQADGTSLDLGKMASLVEDYVLSTAEACTPSFVPFQKGVMTPSTIIPPSEIADVTCAQIMITFFSFVPDAQQWFDYSTSPPTLHIGQRGNVTPVNLPAFGAPVSDVALTPRDDLVVPAVVIKYKQTNTIDGTPYTTITPDIYPVGAQDPNFQNLVADVDLMPGNASYQKQAITVTDRPKDYDSVAGTGALSAVTWAWLTGDKRANWLKTYTIPANWPVGQWPYVQGNMAVNDQVVGIPETDFTIRTVKTVLVDNFVADPADNGLLKLPWGNVNPAHYDTSGVLVPGTGTSNALDHLGAELLTGTVTKWMTSDQSIYSAHVRISITVQYTGSDPAVQAMFGPGPTRLLKLDFPALVTNASSQTYSQLASLTPAEPMPKGLAQNIYQGLSVLHYQGTIRLTEQECSGLVGMGNVVNLIGGTGSSAAWATMNAQVSEIVMDLDHGLTDISVGPPVNLSAGKLTENLRALRGRIPSSHINEQETGKADSDNAVEGAGTTTLAGAHTAPGIGSDPGTHPFKITIRPKAGANPGTAFEMMVEAESYILKSLQPNDVVTVTGLGVWNPCVDSDLMWIYIVILSGVIHSAALQSKGMGSGNGFDPNAAAWTSTGYIVDDGAPPPTGPNQITLNIPIGSTGSGSGAGLPPLKQKLFNNILIESECISGRAALVAKPAPYAGFS